MSPKLTDLWIRAHIARDMMDEVDIGDAVCCPESAIATMRYIHAVFGVEVPLEEPTKEEKDEYYRTISAGYEDSVEGSARSVR